MSVGRGEPNWLYSSDDTVASWDYILNNTINMDLL